MTYNQKERMRTRRAEGGGKTPADRALAKAHTMALKWIKDAMPDVWEGFLAEAYDDLGIVRRRPGRPPKDTAA